MNTKFRPRKIRAALRRRWFEWRMPKLPRAEMDGLTVLGTDYGGYIVPLDLIEDGWICYCVGTGADISFELELLERRRVEIRSFDAVANLVDHVRGEAAGRQGLTIEHAALALEDGPLRMQVSHVPVSQSVSAAALYEGDRYVELPGRSLASLMAEHGDDHIELLKLDIEGFEYELLPALDLQDVGVNVLCMQLHHTANVRTAKLLIEQLRRDGFELVACYPDVKLTFVRSSKRSRTG